MEDSVKKQITIRIDEKLLERIKDIVYYNIGFTLSDFIETTLDLALDGLYEDVPRRPTKKLRPGRKIEPAKADPYDPEYHFVNMLNYHLENGEMTQEQYDWTYNKFIGKKDKKDSTESDNK